MVPTARLLYLALAKLQTKFLGRQSCAPSAQRRLTTRKHCSRPDNGRSKEYVPVLASVRKSRRSAQARELIRRHRCQLLPPSSPTRSPPLRRRLILLTNTPYSMDYWFFRSPDYPFRTPSGTPGYSYFPAKWRPHRAGVSPIPHRSLADFPFEATNPPRTAIRQHRCSS